MPNTFYMNLALPSVSLTLGPDWASQLNAALTQVDSHDHSSGKGVQVPSAGLNVNSDLSFGGYNLTTARSIRLQDQITALTSPDDARCIYAQGGDLWYNSAAGAPVRVTNGGALAGTPGSISGLSSPAAVTYTGGDTRFRFTSGANVNAQLDAAQLTIRQPVAAALGITIQSPNSLAVAYTMTLPGALPAGTRLLTLDNTGAIAASQLVDGIPGSWLGRTVLTSGSGNFTTSTKTQTIQIRIVGGGGGSGGCTNANYCGSGGGGAGAYAEKRLAVSPSTAYAYAVGGPGSAGGVASQGGTGGSTTFTVGVTTVTAAGGVGGLGATGPSSVDGGAGGTASNGDVNVAGGPGAAGYGNTSLALPGNGGSSVLGGGGRARGFQAGVGVGSPGGNYGAGGGGSYSSTGATQLGAAGAAGLIIIDEYA